MSKRQGIDSIINPSKRFIKTTMSNAEGWTTNKDQIFILSRAIVLGIDLSIDKGADSPITPPGSILVKVIGEDQSSKKPVEDRNKWAIPLFTFHNISIPEIGEEVWVTRETDVWGSQLYWINRVTDSGYINKVLAREDRRNLTGLYRYQLDFNVEEIAENVTQTGSAVFSIPFRPGDVIQQGRSDSFIRHSLNPENKEGVLESGIKERTRYERLPGVTVGKTKTKNLQVGKANLKDVTTKTIENDGGDSEDRSYFYNEAEVLVNVSNLPDSSEVLNRQVLGEKLNEWLDTISVKLAQLNKVAGNIVEVTTTPQTIPPFKSVQKISIALGKESIDFDVVVDIPERKTTIEDTSITKARTAAEDIVAISQDINTLRGIINDHLSNHQYIN